MGKITTMEAIRLIDAERLRQQEAEGYSSQHDDAHVDGELLRAAMIYLHHGTDRAGPASDGIPPSWPWEAESFKPKDRRSNLVRAGALLLAERDRILRRSPNAPTNHVNHKYRLAVIYLTELE